MQHHFIVAYDVRDPARLRKVHKTCRDYGDRLQLSVYTCRLSDKDRAILVSKLRKVINEDEDQVLFLRLGVVGHEAEMEARMFALGIQWTPEEMPELIF
ncbi:MAG: CRISPR-associated endonuclease Cas2 [Armatimonadia bacterium]|nr:CRISPR-associated endonuclease Cas2 [Armatimonadia bacterium]